MNRSQIDDAIQSGKPFVIRMADGRECKVPTRDHIAISPRGTFVQVFDDEDRVTSLPLVTMTTVEYAAPSA